MSARPMRNQDCQTIKLSNGVEGVISQRDSLSRKTPKRWGIAHIFGQKGVRKWGTQYWPSVYLDPPLGHSSIQPWEWTAGE